MELQSFIAQSLRSIIEGVREAQASTKDSGAVIVPELTQRQQRDDAAMVNLGDSHAYAYDVEFDIAVAAAQKRGARAKAGISVLGADLLGAGGDSSRSERSTSRIRFKVPVVLPVQPLKGYREALERQRAAAKRTASSPRGPSWVRRI